MVLDSLTPIPPPLKVKDHHLDYLSVDNKSNDVHSDEQYPCYPDLFLIWLDIKIKLKIEHEEIQY